jgi:hypothetical protein
MHEQLIITNIRHLLYLMPLRKDIIVVIVAALLSIAASKCAYTVGSPDGIPYPYDG